MKINKAKKTSTTETYALVPGDGSATKVGVMNSHTYMDGHTHRKTLEFGDAVAELTNTLMEMMGEQPIKAIVLRKECAHKFGTIPGGNITIMTAAGPVIVTFSWV